MVASARAAAGKRQAVRRRKFMSGLPRFRAEDRARSIRLIGELSTTQYESETWIKAGWLGDLRVGDHFVSGRLADAGSNRVFTPEDSNALETIGDVRNFEVFDGYWGGMRGAGPRPKSQLVRVRLERPQRSRPLPNLLGHHRRKRERSPLRRFFRTWYARLYAAYVKPRRIEFAGMGFFWKGEARRLQQAAAADRPRPAQGGPLGRRPGRRVVPTAAASQRAAVGVWSPHGGRQLSREPLDHTSGRR